MMPLENVVVLDTTRFRSGPVCAEILADLGATVIKCEDYRTAGDGNRYMVPVDGVSAEYMSANRGKKSILLDYKNPKIMELFFKLVEKADIVVENSKPGSLDRMGIGYEKLKTINPRIIMTSVSGYGQTGPLSHLGGYDMALQAFSGFMTLTGDQQSGPMKAGLSLADMQAGLWGAIGTLGALALREKTGEGSHVDIAMADSMLFLEDGQITSYFLTGQVPPRLGNRHMSATPFQPFPCKNDEYVLICCPKQDQFVSLCEGLGHPEIGADERYQGYNSRYEHRWELEKDLNEVTRQWDAAELCKMLEERGLTFSMINSLPQVLSNPQIKDRQMIADVHWNKKEDKLFHVVASPVHISGADRITEYQIGDCGDETFEVFGQFASQEELHELFDSYFEDLPSRMHI